MSYGHSRGRERAEVYSFPILTKSELCVCLGELGCSITEDDLAKPKPDVVKHIYETLIESCMGVPREELNQPKFGGLDALEFPELHEDSIPVLSFLRATVKLLNTCSIEDVGIKDISKPDSKRLVRNLSAVINFAKFREERIGVFTKFTSESEVLLDERAAAQSLYEGLMADKEDAEAAREAELPEITALEEENKALEEQINELNKTQAVLRHDGNEIKAETATIKSAIADTHAKTCEAQAEAAELAAKIVQSPDRLKGELAELGRRMDQENEAVDDIKRQKADMAARLEMVAKAEKDLGKAVKLMHEVDDEATKYRKAIKDLKGTQARSEELGAHRTEKETEAKALERQIKRLQDKLEAFRPDAAQRAEAAESAIGSCREDLEGLKKNTTQARAARRAATERRAAILRGRAEAKAEHEAQLAEMVRSFRSLRGSVTAYHDRLFSSITNAYPSGFKPGATAGMPVATL